MELNEMNRFQLLGLTQDEAEEIDGMVMIDPDTGEMASLEEVESLLKQKNDKVMGYRCYCAENAEMFKSQAKKFSELAKAWEKKADAIAEAEKSFMLMAGKKKLVGPWGQASIRKSNVVELDEVKMAGLYDTHPEYFNVKVTPSKTAIKKALKEGAEIDGARIVQKENITVK